jgi:2-haloalkanoic acid dehalogenase type II
VIQPRLLTFDVFGTVIDWRRGLREAVAAHGVALDDAAFDRVVDRQGALEQERPFRTYREITRLSLVEVLGVAPEEADAVGAAVGTWPAYPDAPDALRRLLAVWPAAAMTNSDRAHGEQAQARLGFPLSSWICSEDVRCYKPDPRFFREVAQLVGVELGPWWWHVSAYSDYDLDVAARLGLTTVYVERPHARPGPSVYRARDLAEVCDLLGAPA